ncbi:MAG: hypothetical protein LW750_08945 [Bacteroidetes bacterium]|jgi:hypothetical protein|nr:hypothetical protein [Bacteroidota bacterium]
MKKGPLDHIAVGGILGLVMPVFVLFVYYLFTYRVQTSFSGFIEYFDRIHVIVGAISLGCYATNLPLFFLFLWREYYNAGRGILFATILYTAWVVYEKFIA